MAHRGYVLDEGCEKVQVQYVIHAFHVVPHRKESLKVKIKWCQPNTSTPIQFLSRQQEQSRDPVGEMFWFAMEISTAGYANSACFMQT